MIISTRRAGMLAFLLAGAVMQPAVAAAAGWTGETGPARRAGYFLSDRTPALLLRCAGGGRLAVVVAGGTGLPRDGDYTVVIAVDDTAFVGVARPGSADSGDAALVRTAAFDTFAPLIAALKSGAVAEVSTPRGRYRLPLRGSGKALAALDGGCGA
jgi:hypothetical protein